MRNLDQLEPDPPEVTTPYLVDGLGWFVEWPNIRKAADRQQWIDPVGESVADRVGLAQAWRFVGRLLNPEHPKTRES